MFKYYKRKVCEAREKMWVFWHYVTLLSCFLLKLHDFNEHFEVCMRNNNIFAYCVPHLCVLRTVSPTLNSAYLRESLLVLVKLITHLTICWGHTIKRTCTDNEKVKLEHSHTLLMWDSSPSIFKHAWTYTCINVSFLCIQTGVTFSAKTWFRL